MSDIWPQRVIFRKRLREYQLASGWTQEQVAEVLGVELSHLRNSIYRSEKKLGLEPLQRAAGLFGCSVTEFLDDPGGTPPAGVQAADFAAMSEEDRLLVRMMVEDLSRIDPGKRRSAFDAWNSLMRTIGFIK